MTKSKMFKAHPKESAFDCIYVPVNGGQRTKDAVMEIVDRQHASDQGLLDGIWVRPGYYFVFSDGVAIELEEDMFPHLFDVGHQGEDPRRSFSIELLSLLKEFRDNPSLFQDESEMVIARAVEAVVNSNITAGISPGEYLTAYKTL